MRTRCAIPALLLLIVAAASGQILTSSSFSTGPDQVLRGVITFQTPWFPPYAIVGAPYYGEYVSEHVEALPNGAHITQSSRYQKVWRDSQGRTRTERPMGGANTSGTPPIVQITDPVAGYLYVLDTQRKVAHRIAPGASRAAGPVPTPNAVATSAAAAAAEPATELKSANPRPQITSESLGTRTIDGIVAEGSRNTTVYPTGSTGNDAPFNVTCETWLSKDLNIVVLMTNSDRRGDVHTSKITNIDTHEPDPGLFVPPADYTVVDETSSFTITYAAQ